MAVLYHGDTPHKINDSGQIRPGRLNAKVKKRAVDVPTYFDRPGTSDGPTEAINGRLEHLRGSALQLPQPHQLHRQIPAGNRRLQTLPTPSIVKSRIT